jgi:hypothetical protein
MPAAAMQGAHVINTIQMKKIYTLLIACTALYPVTHAQLSLSTQFINPCGGDEHNEFIVAKTGNNAVNIADVIFGSYNPSSNSNGVGGDPVVNYNYWWRGNNAVSTPYPTFSDFPDESCGDGLSCYGFLYPSVPADAADINTLLDTLNTVAGCTVFLPVPANDIIPANSNVIFFLGAGYRGTAELCGFHNAYTNMNFSNHCSNGTALATYYVVFGTGSGSGPNCTNTTGGYFSNSSRRISSLHTYTGGDTLNTSSYTSSFQDYDPGAGAPAGNGGLIVPNGQGGTSWINNQGCIPLPTTVLAIRLDYFTAVLKDKKGLLKWKSSFEENIGDFEIEKSLNGKDFFLLTRVTPKNISGSEYSTEDASLSTGSNFYRLKVVNLDGTIDYSQVVKINYKKGNPSGWFVYPNPAQGDASLVYQSVTSKKITVILTDIAGKMIGQSVHNITAGNNRVNIPSQQLAAGMYMVTVLGEGEKETSAFIKR